MHNIWKTAVTGFMLLRYTKKLNTVTDAEFYKI